MAALPAARSLPRPETPWLTVMGAMALALVCVAWLLFFIHHISHAISVSHIVDRIASETEGSIDDVMPQPRNLLRIVENIPRELETWDIPLLSTTSRYIRFIDTPRLV